MLAFVGRRELGAIEHCKGIAATDLDVVMPAPIWRTRGADQPHAQYTAVKLQRGFHVIRVDADVINIHGCCSFADLVEVKAVELCLPRLAGVLEVTLDKSSSRGCTPARRGAQAGAAVPFA